MVAVGNVHNTRILRFLLVLIVVILTIFIYASYSTSSTLMPTPMRVPSIPAPLEQAPPPQMVVALASALHPNRTNAGEFGLSSNAEEASKPDTLPAAQLPHKKPPSAQQPHRLPTIDEDALLDGGAGGASGVDQTPNAGLSNDELLEEQQYIQNMDGLMGNINNSNGNGNANSNNSETLSGKQQTQQQPQQQQQQQQLQQQQQPSDADILIPTSNLQKFIENADKILKNMTTSSSSSSPAAAASPPSEHQQHNGKALEPVSGIEEIHNNLLESGADDIPAPQPISSAVMQVKSPEEEEKPQPPKPPMPPVPPMLKAPAAAAVHKPVRNVDPSKGIPTENIYESGHMDNEIEADQICPNGGVFLKLLIIITSAQAHADARMAIRQTWGHYGTRRDVSIAFILGRSTNVTLNKMLTQENYLYGDLIRGSFIDSYNNLTLKTLSSLEWIDLHCSRAHYILKTDDDMFINVPKLLTFLSKHKEKRVIYGRLAKKWKPIRNRKSKYYVSPDQFSATVFPAFTTGPAYVMTGDVVHDLYVQSLSTVYLKLEDVFTTGIVAQKLGIKRVQVNEFLNRRISFNPCNIRNAISVHMIKSNEQFDLWKKLLDQTTKCK